MRVLFTMDKKDYDPAGSRFVRPSARAVIPRGEGLLLIREVREEAGRDVIPESIRAYGRVRRLEKGHREEIFEQENYYFFCRVRDEEHPLRLDEYEREDGFTPVEMDPTEAAEANRAFLAGDVPEKCRREAEREARVLELLLREDAQKNHWENIEK